MRSNRVLVLTLALTAAVGVAQAQSPSQVQAPATTATLPQNAPAVLTVTGKIRGDAAVDLTMAELRALPAPRSAPQRLGMMASSFSRVFRLPRSWSTWAPKGRCCR